MNIIANTCVGGSIYKASNCKYTNPFIGNHINHKDFIKLVNNYDSINFNNTNFVYEQFEEDTLINKSHFNYNTVKLTIDNKIDIHYIHLKNVDIAKEDYYKRLNRIDRNDKPIFILFINRYRYYEWYYKEIIELINTTISKKILLCIDENDDSLIENNFVTIIKVPHNIMKDAHISTINAGKWIYKNIIIDINL